MKGKTKKPTLKKDSDYPISHVPKTARRSFIALASVFIGNIFFTPTLSSGASLGEAFTFDQLIVAILIGNIVLGIYVGGIGAIGARTGLTAVLLAKYTLGKVGAKWADIILGGTQIFWFAITSEYIGKLFVTSMGIESRIIEIAFIIVLGMMMGATAIYGVKALVWVSYLATPLMGALMVTIIVMAANEGGTLQAIREIVPTGNMTITMAITVIIGTYASGATQVANITRFSKNGRSAFLIGAGGCILGNGAMLLAGMLGGLIFQIGDLVGLITSMGLMTTWTVLILTLNIWTINNGAAYAIGVAGAEMFEKDNKNPCIIGGVAIAVVLAVIGISNIFVPMLNAFGTFIPPLGGVVIGDYIFTNRCRLPKLEFVDFKSWRKSPFISYLLGCLGAYMCGVYEIGIPALQGMIIAMFAVPILNIFFKNDNHKIKSNAEYI